MWYILFTAIIIWLIFKRRENQKPSNLFVPSIIQVNNRDWEEYKNYKEKILKRLKSNFVEPYSIDEATKSADIAVRNFITNHDCLMADIIQSYIGIKLPKDILKRELILRKELNKHYKNRSKKESKSLAIYIALQHTKLQLKNNKIRWKNYLGIQILQNNLKSEEYFDALVKLMITFREEFSGFNIAEKISNDISKTFELWSSRIIAGENYKQNVFNYESARTASEKHFAILKIIEYLHRRYKYNQQFRNELKSWCETDVKLYEPFMTEFYSINKIMNPKGYKVPQLESYDILKAIYEQENDEEKLTWLKEIGIKIGNIKKPVNTLQKIDPRFPQESFFSSVTHTIEAPKSGMNGKLAFLDSQNNNSSTEEIIKDYLEQNEWNVLRAEVLFWQAMFCLSFWEEIFDGMGKPCKGNDIPRDLFYGEEFYLKRKSLIDHKFKILQQKDLRRFINAQICKYRSYWTRLLCNGPNNMIAYFESEIVQNFLEIMNTEYFAKILYRIAQNPNKYRSGLPDLIAWKGQEVKLIEVKRLKENFRDSQLRWISWMLQENIPVEIYRVKGI